MNTNIFLLVTALTVLLTTNLHAEHSSDPPKSVGAAQWNEQQRILEKLREQRNRRSNSDDLQKIYERFAPNSSLVQLDLPPNLRSYGGWSGLSEFSWYSLPYKDNFKVLTAQIKRKKKFYRFMKQLGNDKSQKKAIKQLMGDLAGTTRQKNDLLFYLRHRVFKLEQEKRQWVLKLEDLKRPRRFDFGDFKSRDFVRIRGEQRKREIEHLDERMSFLRWLHEEITSFNTQSQE